jgi:predicted anti-sigma-YlaC factor YlaD
VSRQFNLVPPEELRTREETARQRKEALRAARYGRTLVALKRWRTKLKRAKTMVAKLDRRRKYYEKKGD